jgi:hypothetical protein
MPTADNPSCVLGAESEGVLVVPERRSPEVLTGGALGRGTALRAGPIPLPPGPATTRFAPVLIHTHILDETRAGAKHLTASKQMFGLHEHAYLSSLTRCGV